MSKIQGLAIVLLLMFIFVPAASAGFANQPNEHATVTNESVTISTTNWHNVTPSHPATTYYDNETVYYNGSTVSESEYQWNTSTGAIRAVEGGALENASSVDITYTYAYHDGWHRLGSKVFFAVALLLAGLVLFAAVAFLLTGVKEFQGGGGGGR